MTENPRSAIEALLGSQAHEALETRKREVHVECGAMLAACYLEMLGKLDGDATAAWRLFDGFAATVVKSRVPGMTTRDRERDARLLAAYDAAPPRQKISAVGDAAGAQDKKEIDAAWREVKRLLKERAKRDADAARLAADTDMLIAELSSDPKNAPAFIRNWLARRRDAA